jgi:hypothetical protein
MSKLSRQNFEGFARMIADLRPQETGVLNAENLAAPVIIDTVAYTAYLQWQRTLHALMAELHDQSGLTPNGNRSFDHARFMDRVMRLTTGGM